MPLEKVQAKVLMAISRSISWAGVFLAACLLATAHLAAAGPNADLVSVIEVPGNAVDKSGLTPTSANTNRLGGYVHTTCMFKLQM